MKSTKNCSGTKTTKNAKNKTTGSSSNSKKACKGSKSSSQESDSDPLGSYTGNPQGWGKYSDPVQDADDL